MSKRSGWDHNLRVTANGKGLVGHAGAVLLRKCADRVGLTTTLSSVLPAGHGPGWWDRGLVLVNLAVAIVLGGTGMSDIAVLAQPPRRPAPCQAHRGAKFDGVTDLAGHIGGRIFPRHRLSDHGQTWQAAQTRPSPEVILEAFGQPKYGAVSALPILSRVRQHQYR